VSVDIDRPRLIQVCPYYPPHIGGVERVAQSLAARLTATHDVEVWTSRIGWNGQGSSDGCQDGVTVRRLPSVMIANTPMPRGLFRRLLALRSSSVVHVHVAQAVWPELVVLAAAIRRFAVVAHFHLDVDPTGRAGRLLPYYKRLVLGPTLRRANAVITLTSAQADAVVARYAIDPRRVVVMANGVEDQFLAVKQTPRSPIAPLRLLFVGRLEAQKNVRRLLRAVAEVSEPVELVIVGDGVLRAELEQLVADRGIDQVRFVGAQHGTELQDWYAWADAFVLTSDREGMPLALLEAMAAGLAVIATDVSDLATQVGPAGLVVAPDHRAVAAAISQLAGDRPLLASLRDSSRRRGTELGWDPLVARLTTVYAGLCA
jgi:glycosyltransferase involved in cell wall biosynthesis